MHAYTGRIRAIQLAYTEAKQHLAVAERKAPQTTKAAVSGLKFNFTLVFFDIIFFLCISGVPSNCSKDGGDCVSPSGGCARARYLPPTHDACRPQTVLCPHSRRPDW